MSKTLLEIFHRYTPDPEAAEILSSADRDSISMRADKEKRRLAGKKGLLADFADVHEKFGLHRQKDGWVFREYAPNATEIFLTGDFSNWELREAYRLKKCADGVWEGYFPADTFRHRMHYKMFVVWQGGEGMRIPSCARCVVQDSSSGMFSAMVCAKFP